MKKIKSLTWIYTVPLSVTAFLFLTLYFILGFNARLAGDDFFYLWLKNNFGAWDGMLYQYRMWSGRWTAHFIGCKLISSWTNPFFLPVIHFITISFLFIGLKTGFEKIQTYLSIAVEKTHSYLLTIILIAAMYFNSYSTGETWFWYIIVLTYLWSIISFIFLINLIFSSDYKIIIYLMIVILSLYIGGASESYAFIFLVILLLILFYRCRIKQISVLNFKNLKIILALAILLISFSFSFFAPGTEIRHSLLPDSSLLDKFWIAIKAFSKFFIRFLPNKFFYILIFSIPWLLFGSIYLKKKYEKVQIIGWVKKSTFVFLLILIIMILPTTFIMSETGPDRALSIISISASIYFASLFSLLGFFINIEKPFYKIFFLTTSLVSISFLISTTYSQYKISKTFSKACDTRLRVIENALENNYEGVLELEKISTAGMLYWEELSTDTSYFTNQHLKKGLSLPFSVKLKSE